MASIPGTLTSILSTVTPLHPFNESSVQTRAYSQPTPRHSISQAPQPLHQNVPKKSNRLHNLCQSEDKVRQSCKLIPRSLTLIPTLAHMALEVPSCSRCTAKGLTCEPRSTRRTSDSSYRSAKKHAVSPKRFPSANSIQTISRHSSPRSVPSSNRHQIARAVSHMDFHTAVKLGQQRPDFAAMSMLTPLQPYTPQIIDECYSYSSSPEPHLAPFPHNMEKNSFLHSGRLTPQTPEPFPYNEPLSVTEPFDQFMNMQPWSHEGQMPIGLGFENDIPGLMPAEPDMRMWTPDFDANSASGNIWPNPALSVSPPQPPHTRAVPSLSISECSAPESESPNGPHEEWSCFQDVPHHMPRARAITSTPYLDSIKTIPMDAKIWDGGVLSRTYLDQNCLFHG